MVYRVSGGIFFILFAVEALFKTDTVAGATIAVLTAIAALVAGIALLADK